MWTGISFVWLDYELFTAFMFQSASWAVITVALLFVALSLLCSVRSAVSFAQWAPSLS